MLNNKPKSGAQLHSLTKVKIVYLQVVSIGEVIWWIWVREEGEPLEFTRE